MRERQTTIYDVLFEEDRELHSQEYANLRAKQKDGYMNANFFRRNMFNATARGRIQYKTPKVVWEKSSDNKVAISHSLHQRHADILSLMHTDCLGVSKPNKDGSYELHLSLYRLAQLMGYKNPSSSADKVKQFISDMRWTDFVITNKDGEYGDTILGAYKFSESQDVFIVKVNGLSAKILAHTTGIKFDKELTHKIVAIPNNLSKIKAMVRYVIANKRTENGYTLDHIFEKFGIGQSGKESTRSNQKSAFRKQLKENKELLEGFNLEYNTDKQKIYYIKQLEQVTFELPINSKAMAEKLVTSKDKYSYQDMIEKPIKINDIIYTIKEIIPSQNSGYIDLKILNHHTDQIGTARNQDPINVRKYIDAYR